MTPHSKTKTLLKIDNVSLSFGSNLILKNINLEIKDIVRPNMEQGQIVSLLAPSGIGKTQLLKIIANLQEPTTGSVSIGESQKPVVLGDVGVVQQNYPLWKHRTVYSNLMRSAGKIPKAERKDKIETYLNHFGLFEKKDFYPANLSGGQKQRVAIAQQLLHADHFVLFDEPFSGLDCLSIDKVSEMLTSISLLDELNTIIIVSHDISSTCAISDTVWLMGRDKNPDGTPIAGAYIKKEYDLIERGLAWEKDIRNMSRFAEFTKEVRNEFKML